MYFGVDTFTRDTLEQIRPMLADGKAETQKQFAKAVTAVETAEKAETERVALFDQIEQELRYTNDPEKILNYLRYKDGGPEAGERSEFSTLWKMDRGRYLGDPVSLGYGVDYRWEDVEASVRERASVQQQALDAAQKEEAAKSAREAAAKTLVLQSTGQARCGPWDSARGRGCNALPRKRDGKPSCADRRGCSYWPDCIRRFVCEPRPYQGAAGIGENQAGTSRLEAARDAGIAAMSTAARATEQAGKGFAEKYMARVIGLDAAALSPEDVQTAQTFLTAANGHEEEAKSFLGSMF